jgi:hypothetical protein
VDARKGRDGQKTTSDREKAIRRAPPRALFDPQRRGEVRAVRRRAKAPGPAPVPVWYRFPAVAPPDRLKREPLPLHLFDHRTGKHNSCRRRASGSVAATSSVPDNDSRSPHPPRRRGRGTATPDRHSHRSATRLVAEVVPLAAEAARHSFVRQHASGIAVRPQQKRVVGRRRASEAGVDPSRTAVRQEIEKRGKTAAPLVGHDDQWIVPRAGPGVRHRGDRRPLRTEDSGVGRGRWQRLAGHGLRVGPGRADHPAGNPVIADPAPLQAARVVLDGDDHRSGLRGTKRIPRTPASSPSCAKACGSSRTYSDGDEVRNSRPEISPEPSRASDLGSLARQHPNVILKRQGNSAAYILARPRCSKTRFRPRPAGSPVFC